MKKKVFIYVGHSNWGKSMTLKQLTDGNSHRKLAEILGYNVRVRKMSNDDDGKGLLLWVRDFPRMNYQIFIIAFCPKIPPVVGEPTHEQNISLEILLTLQQENELFFFIQQEKFDDPTQHILEDEINWLRAFGVVQILSGQNRFDIRADEFEKFIEKHIE